MVRLPADWKPGKPATYLASDGIEYPVPNEQLPGEAAWEKLKEIQKANNKAASTLDKIVLEKRFLSPAQRQATLGTMQIRMARDVVHKGKPSGITLRDGDGEVACPVVETILEYDAVKNQHGLCGAPRGGVIAQAGGRTVGKRKLQTGDRIKMVNFVAAASAEEVSQALDDCFEIQLSILRPEGAQSGGRGTKRASEDSQQLVALLRRTRLLQLRQLCLCCSFYVMPILCMAIVVAYQLFVINAAGGWLGGLFAFQELAFSRGCGNSTLQFKEMCAERKDEPSAASSFYKSCDWCEDTLTRFVTPSGFVVNSCAGKLVNDFNPGAKGDQCVSDFAGGNRVRFSQCRVGPGLAYESEAQLPRWCDCNSSDFQLIVKGTNYCKLDAAARARKVVDPQPVKVPRNFNEPGSGFLFTAQRVPQFIADEWKDYVGWRIAVAAPASLNVGAMAGYTRANGFLGRFDQRSNTSASTQAAVAASVTTSGLIANLPRGLAFDDAESPADWQTQPGGTRTCTSHQALTTCCAKANRRKVVLPDPPWQGAAGCFAAVESEQANSLPWSRMLCKPCAEWSSAPHTDQIFFWPLPEECSVGPPPGKVNITYDIVASTKSELCETPACLQSTCAAHPSTSALRNPRCDAVLPAMASRCAAVRAEVAAACSSGTRWRHPASLSLLTTLYSSHRGSLSVKQAGVDTKVGPLLTRAFEFAVAWAADRGRVFDPASGCTPPFCFDFAVASEAGSGAAATSWDCAAGSATFESLQYLYPCGQENATSADYGTPGAASSSLAGGLCREAYSIMATVNPGVQPAAPGWETVPECAPSSLGGAFYSSCGDCAIATSCPLIPHYVTPLYQPAASLDDVAADVLRAQFAVRDGTAALRGGKPLPSPTLPLFRTRPITYDQALGPK